MKYLLFLGLPLLVLDQITKWIVLQNIPYGEEVPVIPGFFSLVHVTNTGAAFGMFQHNNLFFILLALTAFAVVLFLMIRDQISANPKARLAVLTKISFGLLAAGVIGNLFDRVIRGSVIDFLHFYVHEYAWPAFNVADSCICVAVGLLVWASFRSPRKVVGRIRPAQRDK